MNKILFVLVLFCLACASAEPMHKQQRYCSFVAIGHRQRVSEEEAALLLVSDDPNEVQRFWRGDDLVVTLKKFPNELLLKFKMKKQEFLEKGLLINAQAVQDEIDKLSAIKDAGEEEGEG